MRLRNDPIHRRVADGWCSNRYFLWHGDISAGRRAPNRVLDYSWARFDDSESLFRDIPNPEVIWSKALQSIQSKEGVMW